MAADVVLKFGLFAVNLTMCGFLYPLPLLLKKIMAGVNELIFENGKK